MRRSLPLQEQLLHAFGYLGVQSRHDRAIRVERHGDRAVSKEFLYDLRVYTLFEKQTRGGVA